MSVNYASSQQQQQDRRGPGTHKPITGAVSNGVPNLIRLTASGHGFSTGNKVDVTGVLGTVEANGTGWTITVIDVNTFDLQSSTFVHAYTSGGMASLQ